MLIYVYICCRKKNTKPISRTTEKLLKIQQLQSRLGSSNMGQDSSAKSPWTGCSQFLPTTQKIIQFSDGKSPNPSDKIVNKMASLFWFKEKHFANYYLINRFMSPALSISSMWDIWISWRRPANLAIIWLWGFTRILLLTHTREAIIPLWICTSVSSAY